MNVRWTDIGAARQAGRYRVEGRTILVRPGDVADWVRNPMTVFRTFSVKLFDGSTEHRLREIIAEPGGPAGRPPLARRASAPSPAR
jgi:hypothetical protein